jgi:hypothetical protein
VSGADPGDRSAAPAPDASGIDVSSGVSSTSGFGFVTLRWGAESGQLTTAEARAHALSLLEAADAAEFDAAVLRWMTHDLDTPIEQAAAALGALRRSRADLADLERDGETT